MKANHVMTSKDTWAAYIVHDLMQYLMQNCAWFDESEKEKANKIICKLGGEQAVKEYEEQNPQARKVPWERILCH